MLAALPYFSSCTASAVVALENAVQFAVVVGGRVGAGLTYREPKLIHTLMARLDTPPSSAPWRV